MSFDEVDQKTTCTICFRFFDYINPSGEVRTDYGEQIFQCCDKYFTSDSFGNYFDWAFGKQNNPPLCPQCFNWGEKLFRLDEKLTEIQNNIQNCIDLFTADILINRADNKAFVENIRQEEILIEVITGSKSNVFDDTSPLEDPLGTVSPPTPPSPISNDSSDFEESDTFQVPKDLLTSIINDQTEINRTPEKTVSLNDVDQVYTHFPKRIPPLRNLRVVLHRLETQTKNALDSSTATREKVVSFSSPTQNRLMASKRKAAADSQMKLKNIGRYESGTNEENKTSEDDSYKPDDSKTEEVTPQLPKTIARRKKLIKNRFYNVAKPFPCSKCKKWFNFGKELGLHSQVTGHINEKKFKCNKIKCESSYYRKLDLKYHKRSHNSLKIFKCNSCKQKFKKPEYLKNHKCLPSLSCEKCDKKFTRKLLLKTHLCTKKTFECKICNANFAWRLLFKLHSNEHNSETIYKCCRCCKSFSKICELRLHRRLKHRVSKKVKCGKCGLLFAEKKYPHSHKCRRSSGEKRGVRVGTKNRPVGFVCIVCDLYFQFARQLDKHCINSGHLNEKKFHCDICNVNLYRKQDLDRHTRAKAHPYRNKKMKHQCKICGRVFSTQAHLKRHLKCHDKEEEEKRTCKICGKIFNKMYKIKAHSEIHMKDTYKCDSCEMGFNTKPKLEAHKAKIHTTDSPFACSECGAKFKMSAHLQQHMRHHKMRREKPLVCEHCGKRFALAVELTSHIRITHKGEKLQCPQCDRSFCKRYGLNVHIRVVHNKEKLFKCEICGNFLVSSGGLIKHRRIHTGEKHYECKECGEKFKSKAQWHTHTHLHTGKTFDCNVCGKSFKSQQSLRTHSSIHRKKRFPCTHCEKVFDRRGNLKTHIRMHTGEKPYQCEVCGKGFSRKDNLNTHRRSHEKTKQKRTAEEEFSESSETDCSDE